VGVLSPGGVFAGFRSFPQAVLFHNCAGLFVAAKSELDTVPIQLAQVDRPALEFRVETTRDVVVVLPLEGGGLISDQRPDGT